MYSKEESQQIKKQFWIAFAEAYPRKWLLHDTKIKDVAFKFYIDNKKAMVMLDIEPKDEEKRKIYFEKIESLQSILKENFLPEVILERNYYLDNGKKISRVWVYLDHVNIFKTDTWQTIFDFFHDSMLSFELFYYEFEDYIKDLDVNT